MLLPISLPTISAYVLPVPLSRCNSTLFAWSVTKPWGFPPFWSEIHPNSEASKPSHFTHAAFPSVTYALRMYCPLTGSTLVNLPPEVFSLGLMTFQPPAGR